jgi:hypothetical protein
MAELNEITVLHALGLAIICEGLGGKNLPQVVRVVVGVSSNLLSLAGDTAIVISQGVVLVVAVEENLGVLVTHGNAVEVLDAD